MKDFIPLITTAIMGAVAIGIALWNRRESVADQWWEELDEKMDKENCTGFRTRLGLESDEHRRNITHLAKDISEIKEGVAYLKGKLT